MPPRSRERPGTTSSESTPSVIARSPWPVRAIFSRVRNMARAGEVVSLHARLNRAYMIRRETREGGERSINPDCELIGRYEKGTENEMYSLAEDEVRWRRSEEIRQEVAMARPETMARENRETRPYVVRDLSWELARYLDPERLSASASAIPNGASENEK